MNPSRSLDSLEFEAQNDIFSFNAPNFASGKINKKTADEQARIYANIRADTNFTTLQLPYQKAELISYVKWRKTGLSMMST
ncbi:MAG: hypothetical protein WCE81_00360 [Halobacteriota archaeon]